MSTNPLSRELKMIRLELARSKDFPNGSPKHGYEFTAPLNHDTHIDPALWQRYRDQCRVRRFWGEQEQIGRLLHRPGGSEHAHWVFDYDSSGDQDDEAGYRFGSHSFRQGEYVSIDDPETGMHTFRIASVTPLN